MRPRLAAATMAALLPCVQAAAGTITHRSVADFDVLDFTVPARTSDGRPVMDRLDSAKMFDDRLDTIRSLGIGGTMLAGIGSGRMISQITLSELTYGVWTGHREAVRLSLGFDANGDRQPDRGWTTIGLLRNDEWRASATAMPLPAVSPDPGLATNAPNVTLAGSFNKKNIALTDHTITIDVAKSPRFNLIFVEDLSEKRPGRDGFDIAEFQVVSEQLPVPQPIIAEPASIALFGGGLMGLLGLRRRGKPAA